MGLICRRLMLGICVVLLVGCGKKPEAEVPVSQLEGDLHILAPAISTAGEPLTITIRSNGEPEEGTPVQLLATDGIGQHVYQSTFTQQDAIFELAESDTSRAGLLHLIARSGEAYGEGTLTIRPAGAVSPVFFLVGPRIVAASGQMQNMAVVVANDALGNALFDGKVTLRVLYPDGNLTKKSFVVEHLVGWDWIDGTLAAGEIRLGASLDGASSPEDTYSVIASTPQSFSVTADPAQADADGRQLITLRTSLIQDANGNLLPDGTFVTFIVETADDTPRRIPAYIIDGVAQAPLQAPQQEGDISVVAQVNGAYSDTLIIPFVSQTIANDIQLSVKMDAAAGSMTLRVGPVTGVLGQLTPDGTEVRFSLTNTTGELQWLSAETKNGYAQVEIRLLNLRVGTYIAEAYVGTKRTELHFTVP